MNDFNRDYNELAAEVHAANEKWWVSLENGTPIVRDFGEMYMLIVSEFAEAMEGLRKNLNDDKIPTRPMVEVELADAVIRMLDIVGWFRKNYKENWDIHQDMVRITGARQQWAVDRINNPATNKALLLFNLTAMVIDAFRVDLSEEGYTKENIERNIAGLLFTMDAVELVAESWGLDLWGAFRDKMEYNRTRPDHQIENRKAEGGKKW